MDKVGLDSLRGTEVARLNQAVTDFQKKFHFIMKACGYTRKTGNTSALYNWTYIKEGRRIEINGWHGTGTPGTNRYWGPLKTFFNLYDTKNPGARAWEPKVKAAHTGKSMDVLVKQQYSAMEAALEYIRKNA